MHKMKKLRPKECSHSFGRSFFVLYLGNPNQREEAKRNRAGMAEFYFGCIWGTQISEKKRSEIELTWLNFTLLVFGKPKSARNNK